MLAASAAVTVTGPFVSRDVALQHISRRGKAWGEVLCQLIPFTVATAKRSASGAPGCPRVGCLYCAFHCDTAPCLAATCTVAQQGSLVA